LNITKISKKKENEDTKENQNKNKKSQADIKRGVKKK